MSATCHPYAAHETEPLAAGRLRGSLTSVRQQATAGLALSYALTSTLVLQGVIQTFTQLEVSMNSVERINFYTDVEQERLVHAHQGADAATPAQWPAQGRIEFRNVTARYRPELPLVLDDVSVVVEPGSNTGFCGRTGSGKSTT